MQPGAPRIAATEPSVRDAWQKEAMRVAFARAKSWHELAMVARDSHQASCEDLRRRDPGSSIQVLHDQVHIKHHLRSLINARQEMRDALSALPGFGCPSDMLFDRDALDWSGVELDRYIAAASLDVPPG